MSTTRYNATYATADGSSPEHRLAIDRILAGVEALKREGIEIEFLGAEQHVDADGSVAAVEARYAAPTKGDVARVAWRTGLPAAGSPVRQSDVSTT